jgi:PIN domain nuclease of toxin-antitoxin system
LNLLLDTNVLVAVTRRRSRDLNATIKAALADSANALFVSAASLWEIAIKTRLGKLDPELPLDELAGYYLSIGIDLVAIDHRHAVATANPEPATRDPFDRMLLAQCAIENMKLLTTDGVLSSHPLSWRSP